MSRGVISILNTTLHRPLAVSGHLPTEMNEWGGGEAIPPFHAQICRNQRSNHLTAVCLFGDLLFTLKFASERKPTPSRIQNEFNFQLTTLTSPVCCKLFKCCKLFNMFEKGDLKKGRRSTCVCNTLYSTFRLPT